MKKLYTSITAILCIVAATNAQNIVQLNMDHRLGDEPFALYQDVEMDSYTFELKRLQYYVSDISITHDGGTVTEIEDVWLLVDANGTGEFDLGSWDINSVESISFYIGVGSDVNHDDPAAWPADHPLYPQSPSMHWGWASGYRFIAMEGYAGPSMSTNLFELHGLGDGNYWETTIVVDAESESGTVIIPIIAEYSNALNDINVSSGLINHSTSGATIPLVQNFKNGVFSAGVANSVEDIETVISMTIAPNPSAGSAVLNLSGLNGKGYSVEIVDLSGRSIDTILLDNQSSTLSLPTLSAGIYLVELLKDGSLQTSTRWSVNR